MKIDETVKSKQEIGMDAAPIKPKELDTKSTHKCSISARVYRAETDTWEDLGVISESEVLIKEEQLEAIIKEVENDGASEEQSNKLKKLLKKIRGD